ncbi:MAG: 4Fe-4S ferredoxin, partial [Anaerolineales bacterium]
MKVIKIEKSRWSQDIETLKGSYRLFGPVHVKEAYEFAELAAGQIPDLAYQNSRLSPKSLVFPQSEVMMTCSLDTHAEDHHVYREAEKDYSPRAVIGIRPCDAKALAMVKMNFDTEEYQDPYWLNLYNATTFIGLACDTPCSTCFCTTAGCGPFHEEGLDALMVDDGDQYMV